MSTVKAIVRGTFFIVWSLVLAPAQALILVAGLREHSYAIPMLWHRGICMAFGIDVIVEGKPVRDNQTVYISNHLSYLDIPVIGSVLKASFVAKKDVADWPVFGLLSRLQNTAFIDRNPKTAAAGARAVSSMLEQGRSLIIFTEGTSSDGRQVLPFKSSLFSVFTRDEHNAKTVIQPLTLRLEGAHTQEDRDGYAWYGDMEMPPHLWSFTKNKGVTVRLIFHDPVAPVDYSDRKKLCSECHKRVSSGLAGVQAALDREGHNDTLHS